MKTKKIVTALSISLLAAVLLFSGCTQPPAQTTTTSLTPQTVSTIPGQTIIKTAQTPNGELLIDANGMILYVFKNDVPGKSNCNDQCAVTWPPVYVTGEIKASSGIMNDIGTIVRSDGTTQAAYKNMPLYYYSGDQNPGDMNGDGFKGMWSAARTQASVTTLPTVDTTVTTTSTTEAAVSSTQAPPTTVAAGPKTVSVAIQNFAFSPATLNINRGDTVIWTNKDSAPHTVTSDTGSEMGSSTLSTGGTYSHTFNTAGTFSYHCNIHASMKAKVIVN